ncbi:MAG TPA: lysylphosphatidylglycerol synthase transmembrane domain-containing protein [Chitinophagaceae bacterium]|nr:lysylphosphatidylglycerol synthase transmembrane domain-containing protein [Chitinophagaceae bacterium]
MNKKLLAYLQYLFFIALAVFFIWLSFRNINAEKWNQLLAALRHAKLWIFFPVLFLLLLSHWLRAVRWKMLIEPLGYHPRILNTFFGVMVGYFVNLGAPRLGEIVKCTVLARYEKVPADKLVGTIVAERAFDLLCLVIVCGVTIAIEFDIIGSFAWDTIAPMFQTKSGGFSYLRIIIILGGLLLVFFALRFIFRRYLHINFIHRLKVILVGILHGLTSIRRVKNKWLFLFHTVSIWLLYLLSTWLGFNVLQETMHLGIEEACAVLVMGSIGMILSPGGIGAYPLFIQQTVSLYGIAADPYGLALGWLLWLGQFVIFVAFGALSFVLLPTLNNKRHAKT